jgi:signal transduction histidine kinase
MTVRQTSRAPGASRPSAGLRRKLMDADVDALVEFSRVASAVALAEPLQRVFDELALAARNVLGARSCAVLLAPSIGQELGMLGTAGFPPDYFARLAAANTRCAPLVAPQASLRGRKQLVRRVDDLVDHDQRFAPLAPLAYEAGWTTIVASPFEAKRGVRGALTAHFAEEPRLTAANLALIRAIADYVGIAVSAAQEVTELKRVAGDSERNRLRRDLHDSISSLLFSLRLQTIDLQVMLTRAADIDHATMAASIGDMHTLIESLTREIRSVVSDPSVAGMQREDLFAAIAALADASSGRTTADVALTLPEMTPPLPAEAGANIIRFLQEAIGNSISHADPTKINVLLRVDPGAHELYIDVIDDGVGFDPATVGAGRLGLKNLRERANELRGRFDVHSDSAGTRVSVSMPFRDSGLEN